MTAARFAQRVLSLATGWLGITALLLLCSCAPDGDPALIGKWQDKDDPKNILEIRKNGTWVESEKDPDISGMSWEWDGTNHIRVTVKSKLVGTASGRMKVALNGDTLILSDSDDRTEYTRVK